MRDEDRLKEIHARHARDEAIDEWFKREVWSAALDHAHADRGYLLAALANRPREEIGLVDTLLSLCRQPDPTNSLRWDIAPGKHKAFSALIAELVRQPYPKMDEA